MQDIYTQLFNSYAHDVQRHLKMAEDETVERLVQLIPMSGEDKVNLADQLTGLRTLCCGQQQQGLLSGVQEGGLLHAPGQGLSLTSSQQEHHQHCQQGRQAPSHPHHPLFG